jgi:phosphatidylserine/phosphatidylglycerophosphate/cardiolipin synthase-like enzyme
MFQVDGETARDVALNFISRWNHHREWNENQPFIKWNVPDTVAAVNETTTSGTFPPVFLIISPSLLTRTAGTCTCQLLRSIDEWSGASTREATINQAYIEAIEDADHYVSVTLNTHRISLILLDLH